MNTTLHLVLNQIKQYRVVLLLLASVMLVAMSATSALAVSDEFLEDEDVFQEEDLDKEIEKDTEKKEENSSKDTDKDGVEDSKDEYPYDHDNDGYDDDEDADDDGDGYLDCVEKKKYRKDHDNDGVKDKNEDKVGMEEGVEKENRLTTKQEDKDRDGIPDYIDRFKKDHDNDGIKNNKDKDDDNDGKRDKTEKKRNRYNHDNDKNRDLKDQDDDNDGYKDWNEYGCKGVHDHDNDGVKNKKDTDDDNDGILDEDEERGQKWDHDNDGIKDHKDDDDDNDGIKDSKDKYKYDHDNDGKIDGEDDFVEVTNIELSAIEYEEGDECYTGELATSDEDKEETCYNVEWETAGDADAGFKLVWSMEEEPTYPPGDGKYSSYYGADSDEGIVYAKEGPGTYYVRVCNYVYDKNVSTSEEDDDEVESGCDVYSNQIALELE